MMKFSIYSFFILGLTESLFKAPSLQEMEKSKQIYLEERKMIHLCQKQLEKNKIPEACYQIKDTNKDFTNYLNKKCTEVPLETVTLNEVSDLIKNKRVSLECLRNLKEKEKILKYQKQDLPIREFLKHSLM